LGEKLRGIKNFSQENVKKTTMEKGKAFQEKKNRKRFEALKKS